MRCLRAKSDLAGRPDARRRVVWRVPRIKLIAPARVIVARSAIIAASNVGHGMRSAIVQAEPFEWARRRPDARIGRGRTGRRDGSNRMLEPALLWAGCNRRSRARHGDIRGVRRLEIGPYPINCALNRGSGHRDHRHGLHAVCVSQACVSEARSGVRVPQLFLRRHLGPACDGGRCVYRARVCAARLCARHLHRLRCRR